MKRLREIIRRWLGRAGTRRVLAGASLGTVMLLCAVAQAAGGHAGPAEWSDINWFEFKSDPPALGWFIIDFIIFLGVLYYLAAKPVRAMFQKRHVTIKESIETAQAELETAQSHRNEYKEKLAAVEKDVERFVSGAQKDGMAERDRIVAAANQYGEQLQKDVETVIEQEADHARFRLQSEMVDHVLSLASSAIEKTLDEKDQQRLLEEAITGLESDAPLSPGATKSSTTLGGAP